MAKKTVFEGIDIKKRGTHSPATRVATSLASAEPTTRLNVEIPVGLHTELKIAATRQGVSIKDLCTKVFQDYLEGMKE